MTAALLENGMLPDAELVAESRRGNREAFGRIVRRYQGMVAGVIYSLCGDLHRSEDLAQETFLSAWKSLSGINDPQKLAPWLCQIARQKAVGFHRSNLREKNRLSQLFPASTSGDSTSPPQEMLKKEESEMLWRILSELPQRYRETMVLYYRQGQSTAAVALTTGTTEEAVRQRLARGREMLRDQMAEVLERNLVRSAPSPAFAVTVMAALPALTPPAAKVATLGAAAKGSGILGSGGVMAWGWALLGPLVAIWAGVFSLHRALRFSRSQRERRFIYLFTALAALCMAGCWAIDDVASWFRGHDYYGLLPLAAPIGVTIFALILIRLGRRHLQAIRSSESSNRAAPVVPLGVNPGKMPLGMAFAVVFTSMLRWFVLAWQAGDFQSVAILSIFVIGTTIVAGYCWGGNNVIRSRRFSLFFVPIVAIITLSVMNWRLNEWLGVIHHWPHPRPVLWSSLILTATVFACTQVVVMELLGFWQRKPWKRLPADVSVGPVRKLDMVGFHFLYVDKQVTLKTISQIAGEEVPKLRAAMKAANIRPRGPLVFIYPSLSGGIDAVLDLKMGFTVEETTTAPEGYQVQEILPATCQTVLHGGPRTTLAVAFGVLGPRLSDGTSTPTGEVRLYCFYFESANSPNNVTLLAAVVK